VSGPSATTRRGDPAILHIVRGREYRSATFPDRTPVEFRSGAGGHTATGMHVSDDDVLDMDDLPDGPVAAAEAVLPHEDTYTAIAAFLIAWQEGLEDDGAAD